MSVYPPDVTVARTAVISDDGLYRYALERRWDDDTLLDPEPAAPLTFVMLNPSTADAELDDPTIRRCVGFARAVGAQALAVVNLYAYRATKPADLWRAADPVGPRNDDVLTAYAEAALEAELPLVAAWGAHARPDRVAAVLELVAAAGAQLTALGVTTAGAPRHPLYLPADARPARWPA